MFQQMQKGFSCFICWTSAEDVPERKGPLATIILNTTDLNNLLLVQMGGLVRSRDDRRLHGELGHIVKTPSQDSSGCASPNLRVPGWPHGPPWRLSGMARPSFQVPAPWQAWLTGSFLASRLVFLSLGLFTTNVCFGKPCFQAKQWERDAHFASAAQLRGQPGGGAGFPGTQRCNVSFVPR